MGISEELEARFKSRNLQVTLFPDTITMQFATLGEFHDFMRKERDYWAECSKGTTAEIRSHFNGIVGQLDQACNQNNNAQAFNLLDSAINSASLNRFPCIYSVNPIAKFIKDKYKENPHYGTAICQYLFQNAMNIQNKDYFDGYLFAFFMTKFDGTMSHRIDAENSALADLRNRYADELNALHKEYLTRDDECLRKSGEMDGKYGTFCKDMTDWKTSIQENADTLLKEKRQELEDLKKLYNEKLRLEGPAKYWADLEEEYQTKGEAWKKRLVWSSSLFLVFLTAVLFKLPDTLFPNGGISMGSVQSTILLAFIASVGIYVIHFFAKMAISAYHMARDAKERYQLTHVYLSLMHEGAVNIEERAIVLQAIFSRVDTGLLKGDAGPTLPEGILGGTIKNIRPQ